MSTQDVSYLPVVAGNGVETAADVREVIDRALAEMQHTLGLCTLGPYLHPTVDAAEADFTRANGGDVMQLFNVTIERVR